MCFRLLTYVFQITNLCVSVLCSLTISQRYIFFPFISAYFYLLTYVFSQFHKRFANLPLSLPFAGCHRCGLLLFATLFCSFLFDACFLSSFFLFCRFAFLLLGTFFRCHMQAFPLFTFVFAFLFRFLLWYFLWFFLCFFLRFLCYFWWSLIEPMRLDQYYRNFRCF